MWKRRAALLALLGTGAAALTGVAARAQEVELEPLPRPVVLYLLDKPRVGVSVRGDHGEARLLGTLEEMPRETLRLTGPAGQAREVTWTEVRSLAVQRLPEEGLPVGSLVVSLTGDPERTEGGVGIGGGAGGGLATSGSGLGTTGGAWRLQALPEGTMTLRGAPYGTMTFPLSRLTGLTVQPIRGNVTELPQANLRVEVLAGSVFNVPLASVQRFQRDPARGTIAVLLEDGQSFNGKLVELPRVTLQVGVGDTRQAIPLERVGTLERTTFRSVAL